MLPGRYIVLFGPSYLNEAQHPLLTFRTPLAPPPTSEPAESKSLGPDETCCGFGTRTQGAASCRVSSRELRVLRFFGARILCQDPRDNKQNLHAKALNPALACARTKVRGLQRARGSAQTGQCHDSEPLLESLKLLQLEHAIQLEGMFIVAYYMYYEQWWSMNQSFSMSTYHANHVYTQIHLRLIN